jgi:poly-gamma-glutamate capsule biosynthesis protein CapA/YwtB (metallophosphatase superfamily)
MATGQETVSVFAVGDVFPDVPDGQAAFAALEPLFATADVVFGNCEGVYSDAPAPAPSHKHFMCTTRDRGSMLGAVGFDVMTLANNHMIDGGYEGLRDTIDLLTGQGIAVTGAGADLAEATRPAVVERNGLRIGFLGFCTVHPVGYEACPSRPGLSSLRVRTHYADPDPNFWEPGIDPVISTVPDASDLERYRSVIGRVKESVDFLVVACHWGYSSWLEVLQDYELELGRIAAESGADAVVCHHHHSLRGVELHQGTPIFYGLGALIHHFSSHMPTKADMTARLARFGPLASMAPGEDLPLFPFRTDSQMTGIAAFDVASDGLVATGLIPALMLADGSTAPLRSDDPRAAEVAEYLERITRRVGFETTFTREQREGYMLLRID